MAINLNKFREMLVNNGEPVSAIEYTKGNYDKKGKLIKKKLLTITTDYCEIGLYNNGIYFVFILKSRLFKRVLFDRIKDKPNMFIYGFADFKTILYPKNNFDYKKFTDIIKKDKYVQIQFDFKNITEEKLLDDYFDLIKIFKNSKINVINQMEVDLTKKNNGIAYIIPAYGESHRKQKGYNKIAEFFEEKGIKPIHIEINWHPKNPIQFKYYVSQFLKKYKKPNSSKVYILGFSYGAMAAFLSEPKTQPNVLILCSLSPYFKEDLPKIPRSWLNWWKKNFKDSNISFDKIAPKIRTKVFIIAGDKEGPEIEYRAKSAKRMIKGSSLFVAKGAKHWISQTKYLVVVKKIINKL